MEPQATRAGQKFSSKYVGESVWFPPKAVFIKKNSENWKFPC